MKMMNSWSADSGDASLVTVGSVGSGFRSSVQCQAKHEIAAGTTTCSKRTGQAEHDIAVAAGTTPCSKRTGSSLSAQAAERGHLDNDEEGASVDVRERVRQQCYHISHSTEINSEHRAFFGISTPRNRPDRSHRTIRFRFGVLSASSTEDEEHEIVLSWSVRTGKRIISYDRIILKSITMKGFGVCDHTLLTPDGKFSIRILSCTGAPLGSSSSFETSELIVNGVSCYDLPIMGREGRLISSPRKQLDVCQRTGRKLFTTVGEILCPEVIDTCRSRESEAAFQQEEELAVGVG